MKEIHLRTNNCVTVTKTCTHLQCLKLSCNFFDVVADCGEPLVIERATVDQGTTLEGAVRRYTCSQNTITEGETTTTCLETGVWSATNLYCRREYNWSPPFSLSLGVLLDIHMHIKKNKPMFFFKVFWRDLWTDTPTSF